MAQVAQAKKKTKHVSCRRTDKKKGGGRTEHIEIIEVFGI